MILALGACGRRGRDAVPAASPGSPAVLVDASDPTAGPLQPIASYSSGPVVAGEGWTRRSYSRDGARMEVTVAIRPVSAEEYDEWVRQLQGYPAAELPIPRASGFFTCAGDGGASACDLHIQTREGLHIEVMGGGHATRADLDRLFRALPWK